MDMYLAMCSLKHFTFGKVSIYIERQKNAWETSKIQGIFPGEFRPLSRGIYITKNFSIIFYTQSIFSFTCHTRYNAVWTTSHNIFPPRSTHIWDGCQHLRKKLVRQNPRSKGWKTTWPCIRLLLPWLNLIHRRSSRSLWQPSPYILQALNVPA